MRDISKGTKDRGVHRQNRTSSLFYPLTAYQVVQK